MSPLRALLNDRQRAIVMGVVNRTPDSFSDGGKFLDEGAALEHIERLIEDGADIIDIGAESTRPGSTPVPPATQIERIGGVIRAVAKHGADAKDGKRSRALVSIDTTSVEVAARALEDGAAIVNTVSLEPAAELGALCARAGAALVLMHCRGSMTSMRGFSAYDDAAYGDVVADVARELLAAADEAMRAGLPREDIVLDPGLGFAKNARHSIELCARLGELCALGFPVLVGPSRKSFIARAEAAADDLDPAARGQAGSEDRRAPRPLAPPEARLGGTIAAALACVARGASIVRAHDVAEVRQAIAVASSIRRAEGRSHA
jgi:dihydropteroate synthase